MAITHRRGSEREPSPCLDLRAVVHTKTPAYLHFRHIQIFAFGLEIPPTNVTVISQNRNIYNPETPHFYIGKTGACTFVGETAGGLLCPDFCIFEFFLQIKSTVKTVPFNLIRFCFLGLECIPLCQRVDSLEVYKVYQ